MKRFSKPETDDAIAQTEAGSYSAVAQLILAGEVCALREQYRVANRCEEHGIVMYVPRNGSAPECWHCHEHKRLSDQADRTLKEERLLQDELRRARARLVVATDCPEAEPDGDGNMVCRYRPQKQAQVAALQADNDRLREQLRRAHAREVQLMAELDRLRPGRGRA